MISKKQKIIGIFLAVLGGCIWALSGVVGQLFFEEYHGQATWITTSRLLIASVFLLGISWLRDRDSFFKIWKDKFARKVLLFYAIFGILLVQLTFYLTIENSNASTATILQFTGPLFILAYSIIILRERVKPVTIFLSLLTILGVWMLVTNGDVHRLNVSLFALFTGILSALAVAIYIISPIKILEQYGGLNVSGWGMLVAGFFMNLLHPIWRVDFVVTPTSILIVLFVGIFGTAIAFLLSLLAVKRVSPLITTLAGATEPILSTLLSIVLFGLQLHFIEIIGIFLIIASVILISLMDLK